MFRFVVLPCFDLRRSNSFMNIPTESLEWLVLLCTVQSRKNSQRVNQSHDSHVASYDSHIVVM